MKMSPILPGSTLGVLGGGQLGRMFAISARRMGYRVHTFSPDDDTPTGQVADLEVCAAYDDLEAVANFARHVDVVTFEFENVPAATAAAAAVKSCTSRSIGCARKTSFGNMAFQSPILSRYDRWMIYAGRLSNWEHRRF
jgi:phosphoribosylaminoimidazole carboxylase (NCAIR synthetase)